MEDKNNKLLRGLVVFLAILAVLLVLLNVYQYLTHPDDSKLLRSQLKRNRAQIDSLEAVTLSLYDSVDVSKIRQQVLDSVALAYADTFNVYKRALTPEAVEAKLDKNQQDYEKAITDYDNALFDDKLGIFASLYTE